MNSLVERVKHYCREHNLLPQTRLNSDNTIIIGLSGGPDSVFLLHALAEICTSLEIKLIAAHLDHGWRAESSHDRIFCQKLAASYNIPLVYGHAQEIALEQNLILVKKNKGGLEEQGRQLRRAFFAKVQQEHHATTIALAHHHDDQKETFFIRLFRGAGVTGLAGIRPQEGNYIHPLLCCTKNEILAFLKSRAIPFVEDITNRDLRFLRNRIRLTALPALRACDERFDHSLAQTMNLLRQADLFLEDETKKAFEKIRHIEGSSSWIDIQKLNTLHPYLQGKVILQWLIESKLHFTPSQALIKEILRFLSNKKSSHHTLYAQWSIVKVNNYARLER